MTDTPADEVPDEPTGATIDGTPWDEARPPHLPDTVTGLPVPTILFTLGAVAIGILTVQDRIVDLPTDAGGRILWVLSLTPPIASFLIPAVFFLRHRDAWSAHRAMAIGTSLLSVGRILGLVNGYLLGWFDELVLSPEGQPWLNPFYIVIQVVVSAIAVFAVVYMAHGLVQARLYGDQPGTRRWWVLVGLVAFASAAMGFLLFGTLTSEVEDATIVSSYWLVLLSVVINIVTVFAWAYFTGTAIAGRRAGEDPRFGWFLAALSGMCILALFVLSGLTTAMYVLTQTNAPPNVMILISLLPEIGYLALLAAFALRLPTTHAPIDDEEDDAAEADVATEADVGRPDDGAPVPDPDGPADPEGATA